MNQQTSCQAIIEESLEADTAQKRNQKESCYLDLYKLSKDDQQLHANSLFNALQEQCILILPNRDNNKEDSISLSSFLSSKAQHQLLGDKLSPQFAQREIMLTEKKVSKWRPSYFYTNYQRQSQQFMRSDIQQTQRKKTYYKSSNGRMKIINQNGSGVQDCGVRNNLIQQCDIVNDKNVGGNNKRVGDKGQLHVTVDRNDGNYSNRSHPAVRNTSNNDNYHQSNNNENNINRNMGRQNYNNNHIIDHNNNNKKGTSIFTFGNRQSQSSPSSSTATIKNNKPTAFNTNSQQQSINYSYAVSDYNENKNNQYQEGHEENVLLDLTYSKYKSLITNPYAYQLIQLENHQRQQSYDQNSFLLYYKSTSYPKQQSSIRQSIEKHLLNITDVMQERQMINQVISEILGEWLRLDECEVQVEEECSILINQLEKYEKMKQNSSGGGEEHKHPIQQSQYISLVTSKHIIQQQHQTQTSKNEQNISFQQNQEQVLLMREQAQIMRSLNTNQNDERDGRNKQELLFKLKEEQNECEGQLLALKQEELLIKQQLQQIRQQQHQVNLQLNKSSQQLSHSQLTLPQLQHQHTLLTNSSQHHSQHLSTCSFIISKVIQYVQQSKIDKDLYILSEQMFQLAFIVLQLINRQGNGVSNNDYTNNNSKSINNGSKMVNPQLPQSSSSLIKNCHYNINTSSNQLQSSLIKLYSLFASNEGTLTHQFVQQILQSILLFGPLQRIIESQDILKLLEHQQASSSSLLPNNQNKNNTILQAISSQLINTITKLSSQSNNHLQQFYTQLQKSIRNYFISKINQHCLSFYQSHTVKYQSNALMTELYQLIDGNSYHSDQIKQDLLSFNKQFVSFFKETFYQLISHDMPLNVQNDSKHVKNNKTLSQQPQIAFNQQNNSTYLQLKTNFIDKNILQCNY